MKKKQRNSRHKKGYKTKTPGTRARPRLSVYRSNKYIYAQLIDDEKGQVLLASSERQLNKGKFKKLTKTQRALVLGEELARKARRKKIKSVVFDRSGYKYHGRVRALAEGARKGGLKF